MSDGGYDDDFENYEEDDFEAEDEDEYDVLPNAKTSPQAAASRHDASPSPPPGSRGPVRVSYAGDRPMSAQRSPLYHQQAGPRAVAAPTSGGVSLLSTLTDEQRRAAVKKLVAARAKQAVVKLSEVSIVDIFVSAPLKLCDLAAMGRSVYAGRSVGVSQTQDEDKEEESQTDEIATRTYACQAPDDRNTVDAQGTGLPASKAVMRVTQTDPQHETKLLAFMRWAGPVMLAAMGDNPSARPLAIPTSTNPPAGALSCGSARLSFDALLAQRPVVATAFCPGSEPLLLAAYAPVGAQLGAAALLKDHTLSSKGVMVVWDLSAPSTPQAVLVSEGSPLCCAWAPPAAGLGAAKSATSRIVFAGMEEGGVCVWHLDEPESKHVTVSVSGHSIVTRRPSYTTEHLADVITTSAPVVALAAVPKTESRSRPCTLITLSGWGCVTVYTVVLVAEGERGMDSDYGLRPGSRVRLLMTTSGVRLGMDVLLPIPKQAKGPSMDQMVATHALQVLPGGHQFLVGADAGRVLRGSWVGVPPAPKQYLPADHATLSSTATHGSPSREKGRYASSVTALHVSPFCPQAFLSGHDTGMVTLHYLDSHEAAVVWPEAASGAVAVVRWSASRPAVFLVLDKLCTLYTWDLTRSRNAPISVQQVAAPAAQPQGVPSLPTFFDTAMANQGAVQGSKPCYCIGYDDGNVDVHLLAPSFVEPAKSELAVLHDILKVSAKQLQAHAQATAAAASGLADAARARRT